MKTLIVATDFSPEAEGALEYACAAAQALQAKVVIFNSFSLPASTTNTLLPAGSIQKLIDHNNELLRERAGSLSKSYGIEVACVCSLMREVGEELDKLFESHHADLIVMGMASSSLAQDLFGNTTTSAIMKLRFPVLAIPPGASYKGIKRILFACDVLRGVQKNILEKIKSLASSLGADVEVFHVQDKVSKLQEQANIQYGIQRIDEQLEGVRHHYKHVASAAVVKEIEKEIKQMNADLLIMVPHKYGFWESLIHRSKTCLMASHSEVPLLSIPLK
ncbi:universal stress protein [Cesiribacter sp. SM1]|uniref:universal stress protein n=1 Tax=Cesiribacter sp. SM1 TaxID=2861196 RepID=UPI001CD43A1C|nr:universal stress protein [Cesiribacter sp. SM1]